VRGAWPRRVVKTVGGLAAVCGFLVLAAGQVSAASGIVVTVPGDLTAKDHSEGVTYSMGQPGGPLATFTDSNSGCPASCQPASGYTATVNWGDSGPQTKCPSSACTITAPTAGGMSYSISANHAYADEDNGLALGFPVLVVVKNNVTPSTASGNGNIAVQDQTFVAGSPFTFNATAGQLFNGQIGVFQDGNALAMPLDHGGSLPEYTVSIQWGDGATSAGTAAIGSCGTVSGLGAGQGCQMGVSGSHTYANAGTPTVTITIMDGSAPNSLTFTSTANVGAPGCVGNVGGTHFYTLDGFGGIHADGVAAAASGAPYWKNFDIARAIAVFTDGKGSGGYVMDAYGGLHPFAVGSCAAPASVSNESYWAGQNLARGLAIAPWSTPASPAGYTVDLHGGVHPFGSAPVVSNPSYWPTLDIIRGIVLLPDSTPSSVGGYTLDAYGGIHSFGDAPAVATPAYWKGWDIARGMVMLPSATHGAPGGYTLDGYGGLHAFGTAPIVTQSAYWSGFDAARAVILLPDSNSTSAGGYTMDLYGGPHQFGTAAPMANGTYAYWGGWAIARGLGEGGEGSGVRKI
jgi:hypothetical protein